MSHSLAVRSASSAPAASASRSPGAPRRRRRRRRPGWVAARCRRAVTRRCSASRTPRSQPRPDGDGRRATGGAHERRHAARRAGPRRGAGLRAASAPVFRPSGRATSRAPGARWPAPRPRRSRSRPRPRRAPRHGAVRDRRRGPGRLPRGRIDGLELPRDAGGRGGDGRRGAGLDRDEARAAARAARAPDGRELGRART